MTGRIFSLFPVKNFVPVTLSGHRNTVIGCYFEDKSLNTYTVSRDGALLCWKCQGSLKDSQVSSSETDSKQGDEISLHWKKKAKHYYNQGSSAELTTTAFHKASQLLITGFHTGLFTLHELPDFILIHTLSISQQAIETVAVNSSGEWLAFGCSNMGQLLVWEWQSETYILKQQGHYHNMNTMCYSQDGHFVATGGDDGKVKLWNMMSGFCFVTFNEHSCAVTGVVFTPSSQVLFSCSLDGTVRAFDLHRYRNFRTFTSPQAVQFSCVTVDSSGEVVCAGSLDTFEIFVWSVKTARLTEVLSGHEGPISGLVFSPLQPLLISGSWDKTVRLWNMFDSKLSWETLSVESDVSSVCVSPDGTQVAVASLDCRITFFDIRAGVEVGTVEGRRDLALGRKPSDKITAKSMASSKYFTSLSYSADGKCVLAGGRSKRVCLYHVSQKMLIKQFDISGNLSLDGMKEFLHGGNMTEAGPIGLIDDKSDNDLTPTLPGVLKGDMSSRRFQPEVRVNSLQFSPTGQSWAAASSEGLVVYSLESHDVFDPFQLECNVTSERICQASSNKEHTKALILSLRLNEPELICQVMEAVEPCDIPLVTHSLKEPFIERLMQFIVLQLEESRHLHFYLLWCHYMLTVHGQQLKSQASGQSVLLRSLQKSLVRQQQDLNRISSSNTYALSYIKAFGDMLKSDNTIDRTLEVPSILVGKEEKRLNENDVHQSFKHKPS
nr:periodic tryptophan protein 2 homolog isoform X2 [Pocillopora verrucosa]